LERALQLGELPGEWIFEPEIYRGKQAFTEVGARESVVKKRDRLTASARINNTIKSNNKREQVVLAPPAICKKQQES
jgi:hypothetical protein